MALPYRNIACCIDDTSAAEEALVHAQSLDEATSGLVRPHPTH